MWPNPQKTEEKSLMENFIFCAVLRLLKNLGQSSFWEISRQTLWRNKFLDPS